MRCLMADSGSIYNCQTDTFLKLTLTLCMNLQRHKRLFLFPVRLNAWRESQLERYLWGSNTQLLSQVGVFFLQSIILPQVCDLLSYIVSLTGCFPRSFISRKRWSSELGRWRVWTPWSWTWIEHFGVSENQQVFLINRMDIIIQC